MWEGRSEHSWAQTSLLAAILAEVNRDRKKRPRPYTSADFNPHAKGRSAAAPSASNGSGGGAIKATPQLLKMLFIDRRN